MEPRNIGQNEENYVSWGNIQQFPLKIAYNCVYNGEESNIPLRFAYYGRKKEARIMKEKGEVY